MINSDRLLFFESFCALMHWGNLKLKLMPEARIPRRPATLDQDPPVLGGVCMADMVHIRNKVFDDERLIPEFVRTNPSQLDDAHVDLIHSWSYHVTGTFYIVHTIGEAVVACVAADIIVD